jgi:spermidine synthase
VTHVTEHAVDRWQRLDSAEVDGDTLELWQRGASFSIRLRRGGELMYSGAHASEQALATLGCAAAATRTAPRVLIGGLGLGYTTAAALTALPSDADVVVAELLAAVVAWNRGPLGHLADHPLRDARVRVAVADVRDVIATAGAGAGRCDAGRFDAILLDVDNGPAGLTIASNGALYGDEGIAAATHALRPGGVLAYWSAAPSAAFERRLRARDLHVERHRASARGGGRGARHVIWLARCADATEGG